MPPRRQRWTQKPLIVAIGLGILAVAAITALIITENARQVSSALVRNPPLGACYSDGLDRCRFISETECRDYAGVDYTGDNIFVRSNCYTWQSDQQCPLSDRCGPTVLLFFDNDDGTCETADQKKALQQACLVKIQTAARAHCATQAAERNLPSNRTCVPRQRGNTCIDFDEEMPSPSPNGPCFATCEQFIQCVEALKETPSPSPIYFYR